MGKWMNSKITKFILLKYKFQYAEVCMFKFCLNVQFDMLFIFPGQRLFKMFTTISFNCKYLAPENIENTTTNFNVLILVIKMF